MNTRSPSTVEPAFQAAHARLCGLLASVLSLGVHGCTEATGGAVELSWALRTTRDVGISDCLDDRIGRIRLWWESPDSARFESFPCRDNHGVTAFDLPLPEVGLRVAPECRNGSEADPASYMAPPPIVRDVAVGETITLDAVLLVLRVDTEDCVTLPCACP